MNGLDPVVGFGGGLPGFKQTVPRAELFAVISLLEKRPVGSFSKIGVDAKYIVRGYQKPPDTAALRSNADLWDQYYKTVAQRNLQVEIFRIYKSHATIDDIAMGRISVLDYVGNQCADAFARRGADLWEYPWDMVQSIAATRREAWKIGLRLSAVTLEHVKAYGETVGAKPDPAPPKRSSLEELLRSLEGLGHRMFWDEGRHYCSQCGVSCLHRRKQVLTVIGRGHCKAVVPPGACQSVGCLVGLKEHVTEEVGGDELDPFDVGDMDLDGCPVLARPPSGQAAATPTRTEHRFVEGRLCLGAGDRAVHQTHRMMFWAGIYYCALCGRWGKTKVVKLSEPCCRTPTDAGREVLKRLADGRPPAPRATLQAGQSIRPVLVTHGCTPGPNRS